MSSFVRRGGRLYWRSSLLDRLEGVVHGVSTRTGGASRSPFASLNVGLHVGDLREDVLCNRALVLKDHGFSPLKTVCGEQVHGTEVKEVSQDDVGRGAFDYEDAMKGVDGLITSTPGIALMGYFADCTPIMFAHAQGQWVGLAHAGWRGTLHGIVREVVSHFKSKGVGPEDLYVALGPRIQPCCYEVGDELIAQFHHEFGPAVIGRSRVGRPAVDLGVANVRLLEHAGVPMDHVQNSDECTACNTERYFSHRASGPATGRMAAVIALY